MVNLYKQELTVLQQEILRVLFVKFGRSLNQRNIAKLLGVSQPAIMKALSKLTKLNLIEIEQDKESKRWAIELNKENPKSIWMKKIDNLRRIYESGLVDFLEKEFAGGTIILFGSYSRGEDTVDSDIDIAVVGRKDKLIPIEKYEKALERKININFYNSLKKVNRDLKENLLNGILLVGGVEL